MTTPIDRITEVLREHSSLDDDEWDRCKCGAPTNGDWAAHVAQLVAAELNLTEERENFGVGNGGILRRWVSEWTTVKENNA